MVDVNNFVFETVDESGAEDTHVASEDQVIGFERRDGFTNSFFVLFATAADGNAFERQIKTLGEFAALLSLAEHREDVGLQFAGAMANQEIAKTVRLVRRHDDQPPAPLFSQFAE